MSGLVKQFSRRKLAASQKKDQADILSAKMGAKVYWVNKASGAYTYSDSAKIMSIPGRGAGL